MADRDPRPPRRLTREEKTIAAMIALYCRDHHAGDPTAPGPPVIGSGDAGLCPDCAELLAYARLRLEKCRYGAKKPTCANCETHCYKPAMRERVREVMRYSGPRMLRRHPVLAVAHLADGRKTPGGAG
jgi:Nitrous oxide-stimulated promoter